MNKYLIGVIALLSIGLYISINYGQAKRKENKRLSGNLEQVTKESIRELDLKRVEYDKLNAEWKDRLDSTIKDNQIKLKQVKSATIIKTEYKDTTITEVIYKEPVKPIEGVYSIPVSLNNSCWGFSGLIASKDPGSKLSVTEKTFSNDIELIVIKKRFLGFLWFTRRTDFKAFNSCGKVDITRIEFK